MMILNADIQTQARRGSSRKDFILGTAVPKGFLGESASSYISHSTTP